MIQTLPHELNRHIGSFLDIDSKVSLTKILKSNEDLSIKRLDSDGLMLKIQIHIKHITRRIKDQINYKCMYSKRKHCSCLPCFYQKNRITTSIFHYIIKVRDDTIFEEDSLMRVIKEHANRFIREIEVVENNDLLFQRQQALKKLKTKRTIYKALFKIHHKTS